MSTPAQTCVNVPRQWFNASSVLSGLQPPLNPQTGEPANPTGLLAIFPEPLIEQEVSTKEYIDIPEEVREILAQWRPTPLVRASRLEKAVGAKAKIFFKNESVSPAGSHKSNSAIAQAFFNKSVGVKRLTTETGGGQWGSALAYAGQAFGLETLVYMVVSSYRQKPGRVTVMRCYGGEVIPSPSDTTNAGREFLKQDPDSVGSLGMAISEAVEIALQDEKTKYTLGSVLNHVLLHQTVIGIEARDQMLAAGEGIPDIIIGCCGGGSNFAGISFPFLRDKMDNPKGMRLIGVEPESCPTLTKGTYDYDYGDATGLTPKLKMYTLGSDFVPPAHHAGGLRYHGMAPLVSALRHQGLMEAETVGQKEVLETGLLFAKCQGIIPAPESCHAILSAIRHAQDPQNAGKTILFNLSGHGFLDLFAYDRILAGEV
jgi:pyridoxal-phosphate dependent TrpB-like enzyme